jgi:hypothetical protein
MPIVTITALAAESHVVEEVLARVVGDVSAALACPAQDVWASFVPATAQHVGDRRVGARDQSPIVLIHGRTRAAEAVAAALTAAAHAVATGLNVALEDVWLQWLEVTPGTVFAGGAVL